MKFERYAVYYVPHRNASWARYATAWLGWDAESGAPVAHPDVAGLPLDEITATPRKYGLHATLKPPFRLADGATPEALHTACAALAARQPPVALDGLGLARMGRFLALRPTNDTEALNALAAACVRELDPYRSPPTDAELGRRRKAKLRPEQEANLVRWGYPYVMEAFRFHITLTDRLDPVMLDRTEQVLSRTLVPLLPRPFTIAGIALAGEDETGLFHLIHRYALSG